MAAVHASKGNVPLESVYVYSEQASERQGLTARPKMGPTWGDSKETAESPVT